MTGMRFGLAASLLFASGVPVPAGQSTLCAQLESDARAVLKGNPNAEIWRGELRIHLVGKAVRDEGLIVKIIAGTEELTGISASSAASPRRACMQAT